jgi:hypothetical protein
MTQLAIEWLEEGSATVDDTQLGESYELILVDELTAVIVPDTEFLEFDGAPALVVSGSNTHITYTQASPAATWTWVHNLNCRPLIALFLDEDLTEPVYTDISYPDLNTAVIEWPSPVSGKAYI